MKKIFLLLIALVLLAVCSACSKDDDEPKKSAENTVNITSGFGKPDQTSSSDTAKETSLTEEVSDPEPETDETIDIDPRAGQRFKSQNWEYLIRDDGTACIFSFEDKKKEAVTLPSELDGIPVTETGGMMFYSNSAVERVTIPAGIIHMDSNPFHNAYSVKEIIVAPGHPFLEVVGGVLFDKNEKRLVSYPIGLTEELNTVEYSVPDGTVVIGNDAFSHVGLRNINLPDSVRIIGDGAFVFCNGLRSIQLPAGVTEIGRAAFYGCEGIKEFYFPVGITCIRDSTFMNCLSLEKIIIPKSIQTIEQEAFSCCINMESITIPSSVTNIGENAFYDCNKLIVRVEKGSYAEQYCIKNNLNYEYFD